MNLLLLRHFMEYYLVNNYEGVKFSLDTDKPKSFWCHRSDTEESLNRDKSGWRQRRKW